MVSVPISSGTKHQKELFVVVEGVYMGQYVYCGRRAALSISDVLPRHRILEDAIVCNVEHHDRRLWCPSTKAPGDYAIVISHNTDNGA